MTITRSRELPSYLFNVIWPFARRIQAIQALPPSITKLDATWLFYGLTFEQRIEILGTLPSSITILNNGHLFRDLSFEQKIEILRALPPSITKLGAYGLFSGLSYEQRIATLRALPRSITLLNSFHLLDDLSFEQKIEILQALPPSITTLDASGIFYDLSFEQKIEILRVLPPSITKPDTTWLFYGLTFEQRIEILVTLPSSITTLDAFDLFQHLSFEQRIEILRTLPPSVTIMKTAKLLDNLVYDQKIAILSNLPPSIRRLIFNQDLSDKELQALISSTTIDIDIVPRKKDIKPFGAFISSNLMLFVSRTITLSGECYGFLAKLNNFQECLEVIDVLQVVDRQVKTAIEAKDNFFDVHLGGYELESLERIEKYITLLKKQDHAVAYLALGILYNNQLANPDNSTLAKLQNFFFVSSVSLQDKNLDKAIEYYRLAAEKDPKLKGIAGFLIDQIQILNENMDPHLESKIAVTLKKLQYESSATFKSLEANPTLFAKPVKIEPEISAVKPENFFAKIFRILSYPLVKLWQWLFNHTDPEIKFVNTSQEVTQTIIPTFIITADNRAKLPSIDAEQFNSLEEYFNKRIELYNADHYQVQQSWSNIILSIDNGADAFLKSVTEFLHADANILGRNDRANSEENSPYSESRKQKLIFNNDKSETYNAKVLRELRDLERRITRAKSN